MFIRRLERLRRDLEPRSLGFTYLSGNVRNSDPHAAFAARCSMRYQSLLGLKALALVGMKVLAALALVALGSACVTGLYTPANGYDYIEVDDTFRFKVDSVYAVGANRVLVSLLATNTTLEPTWFHRDQITLRGLSGRTYRAVSAVDGANGFELPGIFRPHSRHRLYYQFTGLPDWERSQV